MRSGSAGRAGAFDQAVPYRTSRSGEPAELEAEQLARSALLRPSAVESKATANRPQLTSGSHGAARMHFGLGDGEALNGPIRKDLEPRFGHDLAPVRIHHDDGAGREAKRYEARAFTVGTDIVFARGEYAPETQSCRSLLAQELAHVVQQTGATAPLPGHSSGVGRIRGVLQRAAFTDDIGALPSGPDCQGTIDVRAGTIAKPWDVLAVSHLYIVYTSRSGSSYAFRGGPDRIGAGYGHIETACGPYDEHFSDYDTSAPSVRVYSGPDACSKAACFKDQLQMIAATDTVYVPTGPNSNSVVAQLLRGCGLPLHMPVVTAPGFNLGIGEHGVVDLGTTDRRQRASLGIGPLIGPGGTETGLTTSYSIDVAQAINQTFRFPLTAGLLYGPQSGTLLGSAAIGVETPLFNVPFPGLRAPTSLGLGAGIAGGSGPSPTAGGRTEGLLGVQTRVGVGLDLNRVRITLFWQYQYLRSLGVDHERSLNLLGLEAGFTF
jgi:hypothetical protein